MERGVEQRKEEREREEIVQGAGAYFAGKLTGAFLRKKPHAAEKNSMHHLILGMLQLILKNAPVEIPTFCLNLVVSCNISFCLSQQGDVTAAKIVCLWTWTCALCCDILLDNINFI